MQLLSNKKAVVSKLKTTFEDVEYFTERSAWNLIKIKSFSNFVDLNEFILE